MKPLLIIADDNAHMRWLVRMAFREQFEEIIEAADGRELFWHLVHCSTHGRPSNEVVVITDIRMPTYSGLDVLGAYDELGYHPTTIVMTSFPDSQAYAETRRAGGVLVPKPFATAELVRVVGRALGAEGPRGA